MARGGGVAVAMAVALAAVVLLLHPAAAAAAAAGQKKVATAARKEDIPYIRCQVCERIAREISAQVGKKQQALPPTKKVPEIEIIEIAENVCNLKKQEADWMLKIDIVEKGDKLELVEQDEEGHCNAECKTIERACQEVMGYADTDVAEFVYKMKPSADQLVKFLCKDLSEACAADPPPVPKGKVLKDKGSPKKDLKQQVVKQIKDTGKKLKGHVNKVSKSTLH
uniref:Saposin B-type domain-containing protein n=1 Tax=Oryza punctata TaxID=4537 RepID=A0A0E0L7W9_ORYPU